MEMLDTKLKTITKIVRRMKKGDINASDSEDLKYMVCMLECTLHYCVICYIFNITKELTPQVGGQG